MVVHSRELTCRIIRPPNTALPDRSVDLITVAQAFHWFDRGAAQREFMRILRPQAWVALIWNTRLENTTPFLAGYEKMLRRWSTDYGKVNHRNVDIDALKTFFAPGAVERHAFAYAQVFDFEGLRGRFA